MNALAEKGASAGPIDGYFANRLSPKESTQNFFALFGRYNSNYLINRLMLLRREC